MDSFISFFVFRSVVFFCFPSIQTVKKKKGVSFEIAGWEVRRPLGLSVPASIFLCVFTGL